MIFNYVWTISDDFTQQENGQCWIKDLHGTSRMDVKKFQDKTKPNINMDDKNGLKDVYRMKGWKNDTRDEVILLIKNEYDNTGVGMSKEGFIEPNSDLQTDHDLKQLQAKKPKMMFAKSEQKND